MSKAFESIAQGLREAIALNEGEEVQANTYRPEEIDVGQLRHSLGLTQTEFAAKFCISLGTLRHWERGDRKPHGPAACGCKRTASSSSCAGLTGFGIHCRA
jgi:putative transcriptional regulator